MRFTTTAVDGVFVVETEPHQDDRGWFARVWCAQEFAEAGLPTELSQANLSFNSQAGTLRGLHLQRPPHAEAKLVRCVTGSFVDVAVDVRPGSPTYLRHVMIELSASNRLALQLPPYVAHGFQTLEPNTTALYHTGGPYTPEAEQGFRHDDEAFSLQWPLAVADISAKDAAWPAFDPTRLVSA